MGSDDEKLASPSWKRKCTWNFGNWDVCPVQFLGIRWMNVRREKKQARHVRRGGQRAGMGRVYRRFGSIWSISVYKPPKLMNSGGCEYAAMCNTCYALVRQCV